MNWCRFNKFLLDVGCYSNIRQEPCGEGKKDQPALVAPSLIGNRHSFTTSFFCFLSGDAEYFFLYSCSEKRL